VSTPSPSARPVPTGWCSCSPAGSRRSGTCAVVTGRRLAVERRGVQTIQGELERGGLRRGGQRAAALARRDGGVQVGFARGQVHGRVRVRRNGRHEGDRRVRKRLVPVRQAMTQARKTETIGGDVRLYARLTLTTCWIFFICFNCLMFRVCYFSMGSSGGSHF